jgi:hypothetical protein
MRRKLRFGDAAPTLAILGRPDYNSVVSLIFGVRYQTEDGMKRLRSTACVLALVAISICGLSDIAGAAQPSPGCATAANETRLQADWLRQAAVRDVLRAEAAANGLAEKVLPNDDAAGAVDGVKNGRWGFHTGDDDRPWWQVDLKEAAPLAEVKIFNRCDSPEAPPRSARLEVLISGDAKTWKPVYQHDGKTFWGFTDNKPLKVPLGGALARYVRVQLPAKGYLHLDEVEVYRSGHQASENIALHKPATQSSTSQWSTTHAGQASPLVQTSSAAATVLHAVQSGLRLADDLRRRNVQVEDELRELQRIAGQAEKLSGGTSRKPEVVAGVPAAKVVAGLPTEPPLQHLYLQARRVARRLALKNPLLDFDDLLFVKRAPGSFTHMSDQYYGWFSRPGGGLCVLEGWKTDAPRLRSLTSGLPAGNVLRPDLSYDGQRVLFAYAKFYPGLAAEKNKLDKSRIPEDAFYHVYEVNLDGSGLRRLTRGKYDDFDARYLPDGRIVLLSTRRGRHVQCNLETGQASSDGALPDSYVRCGGGPERPVAVYTLHVMDRDGGNLHAISAFENFEWTPSIDHHGRILYARWDYVDRDKMPYMKLWATMPDGTNPQALYGNYTLRPHCVFDARAIPGSEKLIFTASGHHAFTGGSLVLLDLHKGSDGEAPLTRLTPEVCFPEIEGWPKTYFTSPYPLSEEHYLVSWSDRPLPPGVPPPDWGLPGPVNDLGLYLFDTFGNLNLVYRDAAIGSECPIPVRARPAPPMVASAVAAAGPEVANVLVVNVYRGLEAVPNAKVRRLRIVGVPAKTHPTMNHPSLGMTGDDPGKFVLGTVPVEADGSAHFQVPAGVPLFFQALDEKGMAVQTMRSATYFQPGEKRTCIGCHESRHTAPPPSLPLAATREPSKLAPGPEGSWPLDYRVLVQPVLDRQCVSCHKPGGRDGKFLLAADKSYEALVDYGKPSLRSVVWARYNQGRSTAGEGEAATSPLLALLAKGHYDVRLTEDDWQRLTTWMDTYGQRLGSYDRQQEDQLVELRRKLEPILAGR